MPAPGPASGTSCFRREGRRPAWRKWSSWASNGARTRVDLLHGFSWPASMLACFNAPLLRSQQKYFPMLRWTAGSRTYGLACAQFQPSPLTPRAKCHPDDGASLFMSTIAPALLSLLQMAFQHYFQHVIMCARAQYCWLKSRSRILRAVQQHLSGAGYQSCRHTSAAPRVASAFKLR